MYLLIKKVHRAPNPSGRNEHPFVSATVGPCDPYAQPHQKAVQEAHGVVRHENS